MIKRTDRFTGEVGEYCTTYNALVRIVGKEEAKIIQNSKEDYKSLNFAIYKAATENKIVYGKDVRLMQPNEERALIGNYRTLGMLRGNLFTEINDRKQCNQYIWNKEISQMTIDKSLNQINRDLTISYYQTASERFKSGKMKE